MRRFIFIITVFFAGFAQAQTSHCPIIEGRLTESIASCLASIDGVVSAAVVDVKAPIAHVDGKVYLTRSEKEAEALKEEIITNLKTLAGQDIKIFASSRVEKNSPRLVSVDLIVGPRLQTEASEQKKNIYFLQSAAGVLHHDNGASLYRDIYFSGLKVIKDYRLGLAIESSSDDRQMDLMAFKIIADRHYKIGGSAFSIGPGLFVGTLSTSDETSLDVGASASLRYLFNDTISLYIYLSRGRFTGASSAGLEVAL